MPAEETVDLGWFFAVIRRWLWLILGCALLGAAIAFVISSRTPPVYSASVSLLINPPSGPGMSDYEVVRTSERLARTYSQMLKDQAVLEAVIEQLQLSETRSSLAKKIKVELVEDTQLIRLSVEHRDPAWTMRVANALAEAFVQQIQALQSERYNDSLASLEDQIGTLSDQLEATQARIDALGTPKTLEEQSELAHLETLLAGYRNTYAMLLQNYEQMRLTALQSAQNVVVVDSARVPTSPRQLRLLYTSLAGVLGALAGIGLAFLLESLDDTIQTPRDVRRMLGLSTLGTIGRLARADRNLVVADQPQSPHSEAYRVLSTHVCFSGMDGPCRTLLVTSPGVAEGKTVTSANLSVALAQAGVRVVVVDADLRRSALGLHFEVDPRSKGLSSVLQGARVDDLLQPTKVTGLSLLTSGQMPPNPTQLLGSDRMQRLLDELAQQADVVLIDGPPVLPVADTALLARQVDGVLLVLKTGRTRRDVARQAVENLHLVGASLVGAVLNGVSPRRSSYHYASYRYEEEGRLGKLWPGRKYGADVPDHEPERPQEGEVVVEMPVVPDEQVPIRSLLLAPTRGKDELSAPSAGETQASVLSMRDVEAGLEEATPDHRLSQPSAIPKAEAVEIDYGAFAQRNLSGFEVEYLFLDAVPGPLGQQGRGKGVLCAWAICADGGNYLLHLALGNKETYGHWRDFLGGMVEGGLQAPVLVVTDGTAGLIRAAVEIFPRSLRQRCLAPKTEAVIEKVPDGARAEVKALVQAAYYAPNRQVADLVAENLSKAYKAQYPFAVSSFQDDWEACVAYLRCPPVHHRRIRTTSLLSRTLEEEQRRTTVYRRFFTQRSDLEPVFASLWQASQRWLGVRMGGTERHQLEMLRRELGLLDERPDAVQARADASAFGS